MRTSFGIACMCAAANAFDFDWANLKNTVLETTLGEDFESHPVYQFHGTDRRYVRENVLSKRPSRALHLSHE